MLIIDGSRLLAVPSKQGDYVSGSHGTGPVGLSPMTGARRGRFPGAVPTGARLKAAGRNEVIGRGERGRRNQLYATGLTGWHRTAPADAQATAAMGDAPDPLSRVEGLLAQVFERLDRLESGARG